MMLQVGIILFHLTGIFTPGLAAGYFFAKKKPVTAYVLGAIGIAWVLVGAFAPYPM